jgi:hypothetical protein
MTEVAMRYWFLGVVLLSITTLTATAAVPTNISVQGRLTDGNGSPLPAGPKSFTFRIYDAQSVGNKVWPASSGEMQTVTSGSNGIWIALVGAIEPLSDSVFSDTVRWLEISVEGATLPRVRLPSGPYAYRVATIDGATGGSIDGHLGVSEMNPTSVLDVNGSIATGVRYTFSSTDLDESDNVIIAASSEITITLPLAADCPGRHYMIKNVNQSGAVTIGVAPGSGDTIDGNPTLIATVQYQSYSFVSDGLNTWLIID